MSRRPLAVGLGGIFALAILVVLALPVHLAGAQASSAATVSDVGWWTRDPVPTAPPPGGIAVGNAPDGALTVSAIRVQVPSRGLTSATLHLQVAQSQSPLGAGLKICVTKSAWQAASAGAYASAPTPSCNDGSAALNADSTGNVWTADITGLLNSASSSVSVMVVPADGAPAVFEVTFQPPAVQATATQAPPDDEAQAVAAPLYSPPAESGVAPPSSLTGAELSLPAVAFPVAPTPAGTEASTPAPTPGAVGLAPLRPSSSTRVAGQGRNWAQAARLVLLSVAVGAATVAFRRLEIVRRAQAMAAAISSRVRAR